MSVLFFTCANLAYEDFAPLYAFSVLTHVSSASLEIGVESVEGFNDRHKQSLLFLRKLFGPQKFLIREVSWHSSNGRRIVPNSVRFINEPITKAEHVYIGDVDIIVLERDLVGKHLKHMKETGLPYSNSVRPSTDRMSGLHFTRMDAHYPLPNLDDLDLQTMNDERILYQIISRNELPIIEHGWYRPIHGIHISPHRTPEKVIDENGKVTLGWGIASFRDAWIEFSSKEEFRQFRETLSVRVRHCISIVDAICMNGSAPAQATGVRPLAGL